MSSTVSTKTTSRIYSIDFLRGIVMIIMALDHTRDFFHIDAVTGDPLNMQTTTPILFFTRWITHFCAPIFVFLSGVSAYIANQNKTRKEAGSFLIKRGLWLIIVEVTLITFALTFNPLFSIIFLQVIWAIGLSMILLGLLVRTSLTTIIIIGALLVFGHNIFDYFSFQSPDAGSVLLNAMIAAPRAFVPLGSGHTIIVLYTALPWTGVMLLGYALGSLYKKGYDASKRKKFLLRAGLIVTTGFIVLRFINVYGDPLHWETQKNGMYTLLSFLNTSKYPPSLLFCGMTLGPALLVLSATEQVQDKLSKVFMTYGRVPFFYYVLHFYILHTLMVILFFATGFNSSQIVDPNVPFLFRPTNFGFNLGIVYIIWISVVAVLYKPCKWFDNYKKTHSQWWLRYL